MRYLRHLHSTVPFPRRKKFRGTQKTRKFGTGIPSIPRNENARNSVPSHSAEDTVKRTRNSVPNHLGRIKNSEFRSEPYCKIEKHQNQREG
jgi:hypothetical protein